MIQPSALNFLIVMAFVIIGMFFWRSFAARWCDRPVGQAMGSIM